MFDQQHILKRDKINLELDHMFGFPLTVVVAAMGYGKTTTAKQFLDQAGVKYAWVSVEGNETSPQYIWNSLTKQLGKSLPELGNQLRALGFPVDAAQREKVLEIIEEHAFMANNVLVIDDYHFAHSPELNRLIERIIRANISGFHILILSRTMPDFNIDEFVLKGLCFSIKSSLFEVGADEIKEYFRLYGFEITDEMAHSVHEISEGWISAIYLMMRRYAEVGKVETGKSIENLISTAVMWRYSAREISILRSLCILSSFSSQQAVYVTDDVDAEKIIQKISLGNSFIRYDEKEDTYKIHKIMSSYLMKTHGEASDAIDLDNIYKRSGQWSILNGDMITGLRYLIHAQEYDLILAEFEKSSINTVMDSNPGYILEIFEKIPLSERYRHPIAYLSFTGFYVTNIDPSKGARRLDEIERFYGNDKSISPQLRKRIDGEIELIRAYCSFNNASAMCECLKRAHEMLGGQSNVANEDKIITFGSPHALYLYYREKGMLRQTMGIVKEMFPYYMEMAGGCGKGFDNLLDAEYCLETGDLNGAELHAYKAVYKAKSINQVSVLICSKFAIARVYAAQGRFDDALEVMDDLSTDVESRGIPMLNNAFDLCVGYIGGVCGKENEFAKWLRLGNVEQSEILYQGMGFNYIIHGKYLLVAGEYIKLEVLCEDMRIIFSKFNNLFGFLHTAILDAVAKNHLYGAQSAKTALAQAIEIGRADAIVLPFAEYGNHILGILKRMQKDCGKDVYLDRLVKLAAEYTANLTHTKEERTAAPKLTNREKQILESVLDGKTNREIAALLFLAEVTVRKNITSIYRKLEVNGRAAAVKRAMDLKII